MPGFFVCPCNCSSCLLGEDDISISELIRPDKFYSSFLPFPLNCRIKVAVEKKACNCLLLKVNQIGSVSESIEA